MHAKLAQRKKQKLSTEDEHFLLYADVGELQSKNESLIRVVRQAQLERHKMAELMEKQGIKADGSLSEDFCVLELDSVLSELQEMKTARVRTEEMVLGLIQQRDMLKMMLQQEKEYAGTSGGGGASSATSVTDGARSEQAQVDLAWQLKQANAEVERLSTKLHRLTQVESSLEESLAKVKQESSEASMKAARFESAEYNFQKERWTAFEEVVASSQREIESQMARLVEGG